MASLNDKEYSLLTKFLKMVVGVFPNTIRLAVDSQQTSFEENHQFRYFRRIRNLAPADQLVFYISTPNAVNLFNRVLSAYAGGRLYDVYADDGSHTFTGTLAADAGRITPMNNNLSDSGLSSHPSTLATVQSAIGPGIFVPGSEPIDGTEVLTDGNANRASSSYSSSGERFGTGAGQSFWVVLDPISGAPAMYGSLKLIWEERF